MKNTIEYWRDGLNKYLYLGKTGKVLSYTRMEEILVAVIDFGKNGNVIGSLINTAKKIKIGDRVIGVIRRVGKPNESGLVQYGVKFKLL